MLSRGQCSPTDNECVDNTADLSLFIRFQIHGTGWDNPRACDLHEGCGTTHTYGEARQREGLPVKKYIHLKSFQPRHHYQKIKQSLHIVLLFGAVPWAWTLGPPVSLSQVCHPCLLPVSHGQSSLEKGQAQTLTQLSPNESLLFLKLCPREVVCLYTQKL